MNGDPMAIRIKRAYDDPAADDGYRVLVDRLWPRGLAKSEAELDDWLRSVAPDDDLRRRFHAQQISWGEFRRQYLSELKEHRETLRRLSERARSQTVTLIFSAKNEKRNNAVVVKQYLEMLGHS